MGGPTLLRECRRGRLRAQTVQYPLTIGASNFSIAVDLVSLPNVSMERRDCVLRGADVSADALRKDRLLTRRTKGIDSEQRKSKRQLDHVHTTKARHERAAFTIVNFQHAIGLFRKKRIQMRRTQSTKHCVTAAAKHIVIDGSCPKQSIKPRSIV